MAILDERSQQPQQQPNSSRLSSKAQRVKTTPTSSLNYEFDPSILSQIKLTPGKALPKTLIPSNKQLLLRGKELQSNNPNSDKNNTQNS
jgi:hypothetical protein